MNEFHKRAAIVSLKSMFGKSYFDITVVDACLKLSGCIPDRKDYEALRALHCVHWNEMEKDLREMVLLKTMQMFEQPGLDVALLDGCLKNDLLLLN
jgi:hypothetical protein